MESCFIVLVDSTAVLQQRSALCQFVFQSRDRVGRLSQRPSLQLVCLRFLLLVEFLCLLLFVGVQIFQSSSVGDFDTAYCVVSSGGFTYRPSEPAEMGCCAPCTAVTANLSQAQHQ